MTACSVLSHYDINQLQVFEWSLERKIKECSQANDPCDDLASMNYPWPPEATECLGDEKNPKGCMVHIP